MTALWLFFSAYSISILVTSPKLTWPFCFLWKCALSLWKLKLLFWIVACYIVDFLWYLSRAVKTKYLYVFLVEKKIHKKYKFHTIIHSSIVFFLYSWWYSWARCLCSQRSKRKTGAIIVYHASESLNQLLN